MHTPIALTSTTSCSSDDTAPPEHQTIAFLIPNMDCLNEVAAIRKRLDEMENVDVVDFDLSARRLTVRHGLSSATPLLDALREIGMQAMVECFAPTPTETTYYIAAMNCRNEEAALRKALGLMPGILGLEFDLKVHTLTVAHTLPDIAPISTAIRALGLDSVARSDAAC